MRVKIDENLGERGVDIFRRQGHDVHSVTDRNLIEVCRTEQRCLITLDLDFSNPLVFPPHEYAGIAVLRMPSQSTPPDLQYLTELLASQLETVDITGRLWIVQRTGVREYRPETDE